jgi:hypothetical protein
VIDIGGAKGHLLAAVQARRPDLDLTLSDISEKACVHAERAYGLRAVRGSAAEVADLGERFDVVLMIDVLYYEPDIRGVWRAVDRLAGERSTVIIRVPNRLGLISLQGHLRRLLLSRERREAQTSLGAFNPEHIYVFSRRYLRSRLQGMGYSHVDFVPSPLLRLPGVHSFVGAASHRAAALLHRVTLGAAVATPCVIAVARRSRGVQGQRAAGGGE